MTITPTDTEITRLIRMMNHDDPNAHLLPWHRDWARRFIIAAHA